MTEVGVSLALRRHRGLIGSADGKPQVQRKRLRSPSGVVSQNNDGGKGNNEKRNHLTKKKSEGRIKGKGLPSYSSWQIVFEVATLYIFCMILPSLLAFVGGIIQTIWRESTAIIFQIPRYICSQSWFNEWQTCQKYLPEDVQSMASNSSVLASDARISDLAIVICLSLSMAVTRILLVHFLVPNYKQPKRLEALVRCKSIHLLSSSYSGAVTPTKSMRLKSFHERDLNALNGFHLPNLNTSINEDSGDEDGKYDDRRPLLGSPSNQEDLRIYEQKGNRYYLPNASEPEDRRDTSENSWFIREELSDDDENEGQHPAPAVSSGLLTRNSAQNLQALLEQAAPQVSTRLIRRDSFQSVTNIETTDRIFAAPKYATAVFRSFFCVFSCLIGLYYFWAADFWPPAVGGSGSTKNCWDLSSVGATLAHTDFDIVDSDLTGYNPVLRQYYLIQASYHFHSAAFHILTSILLWFVSKSTKKKESSPRFLGFIHNGMFTFYNIRNFFQHIFSLGLILGTYLFSSTRRLGAIAMFSFDASSLFLHVLQLRINAPRKGSDRSRRSTIIFLHRFLVIPVYCYARFYVFPFVVGYSAMEESQDWLQQLENMLMPGTAKFIHGFFVIAFLLFLLMNIVYFWRLLNHPHMIDARKREKIVSRV
mmetsp:Transcript_19785/g.49219  ORF Transcript_19785/g.49219 Transcript_19785/m.49219 type:complete len:649 (+) Transcript_19785:132-2078(+)